MQKKSQQKHPQILSQPIKTYLYLFSSPSISPHLPQYQIIENKILLHHQLNHQTTAHHFSQIFTNRISYRQQLEHVGIINDCFEGKNQLIIANIQKDFITNFILGSEQNPGFIIQLLTKLFTFIQQKKLNITISIFTNQSTLNKFIDLILGQKFIFILQSNFIDFYHQSIQSMTEFLVVFKIALLNYQHYCQFGEPIVIRLIIDIPNQQQTKHSKTILHLFLCQPQIKQTTILTHKLLSLFRNTHHHHDHSNNLCTYLQKIINNNKIIYIYGIYQQKLSIKYLGSMLSILNEFQNYTIEIQPSITNISPLEMLSIINNSTLPKPNIISCYFTQRELHTTIKLLQKLSVFLTQTKTKSKTYCRLLQQILNTQQHYYDKLSFPISLQITSSTLNSFFNCKILSISPIHHIDDLTIKMQKIHHIKNQIYISLKSLTNCKQYVSLFSSVHVQQFIKYYWKCLNYLTQKITQLFSFTSRQLKIYNIKLLQHLKIDLIFNPKVIKQQINVLKSQLNTLNKSINPSTILLSPQPQPKTNLSSPPSAHQSPPSYYPHPPSPSPSHPRLSLHQSKILKSSINTKQISSRQSPHTNYQKYAKYNKYELVKKSLFHSHFPQFPNHYNNNLSLDSTKIQNELSHKQQNNDNNYKCQQKQNKLQSNSIYLPINNIKYYNYILPKISTRLKKKKLFKPI